jgi:hypothetical protein
MARIEALAKRKLGVVEEGRRGKEDGLVQIERTEGSGVRTVGDMQVDHGSLY